LQVIQSNKFQKSYKKLFSNQLPETNDAINKIIANPEIGEQKHGDLSWLRVYKYKCLNLLTLIGYKIENDTLLFVALGPHENFYRDVKR